MYCGTQVLALTLSLCLMTACKEKNQNNQSQLVNVVEVTPSAGTTSASYPAETEAMNKTDLSFKVAGTIAQVLVKKATTYRRDRQWLALTTATTAPSCELRRQSTIR